MMHLYLSFHRLEAEHAAGVVVLFVVVHTVCVGQLQPVGHEVSTAIHLALARQRLVVDTVQLVHAIELVGLQTRHGYAGQMLIDEMLRLPPIEHGLVLRRSDIHQRSGTLLVVRREQTVDVALLHDGTDGLILGNGLLAQRLLLVRHVLGLDFHAQAAAHGHIDAILQRDVAESLVIGRRAELSLTQNSSK